MLAALALLQALQLNVGVSRTRRKRCGGALRSLTQPPHLTAMRESRNIKPDAQRLVANLPDSATWDDLAYEVYVRQAIEAGLAEADSGQLIDHEDALARVRARIRRAS